MALEKIRILSFDPGLSTAGWSYSEYRPKVGEMVVVRFGTLYPNKDIGLRDTRPDVTRYGSRIMTLESLRVQFRELMDTYHPDFIVSEDAFYNPSRPTAYCALIQWLTTIALVLHDEYQQTLFKLAPKIAKQVVSGFGGAEKLGVQYAIMHKNDIRFKQKVDVSDLSEHICDSIGIGYTFIQEILPSILDIWRLTNVGKEERKENEK